MIRWRKVSPGSCDTQVGESWHRTASGETLDTPDDVLLNTDDWVVDDAPAPKRKAAAVAAQED